MKRGPRRFKVPSGLRGDRIEMENSYQYAEQYLMVMKANNAYED
jgi:hypothetical protein